MLRRLTRNADAEDAPKGVLRRRWWMITVASLSLMFAITVASPVQAAGHKKGARYWKGRNISQAVAKFGEPTLSQPLAETGGSMYIFARRGETHWVFETDPGGKIVKASQIE
jgi:hypothetical protein